MEILLLVSPRGGEPSAVLPALDLLPHTVRTAPRDVRTLVSGPSPDAVLVDARSELAEARATCRMLHATGLGRPPARRRHRGRPGRAERRLGRRRRHPRHRRPRRGRGPAAPGDRPAGQRHRRGRRHDPRRRADHRPGHLRGQAQGPPARPDVQGVRAAEVPRPAPGPGLHPRPAAARGLGLRLLRRHPHRRRPRPAAAGQARLRVRVDDRHRAAGGLQVRRPAEPDACPTASPPRLPSEPTGANGYGGRMRPSELRAVPGDPPRPPRPGGGRRGGRARRPAAATPTGPRRSPSTSCSCCTGRRRGCGTCWSADADGELSATPTWI